MNELFEKSIQTLELPRVLEMLAGCAVTDEGRERALALRPMTDIEDVRRAQEETSAAVKLLILRGTPGFAGIRPVAASLQRADMGGSWRTRPARSWPPSAGICGPRSPRSGTSCRS